MSIAHTGYEVEWASRDAIDEIVYSLAGGAVELACDLKPLLDNDKYGTFPVGMKGDLPNLEAELGPTIWANYAPNLQGIFQVITEHFREYRSLVHEAAMELRRMRILGPEDLANKSIDRKMLLDKVGAYIELLPG